MHNGHAMKKQRNCGKLLNNFFYKKNKINKKKFCSSELEKNLKYF